MIKFLLIPPFFSLYLLSLYLNTLSPLVIFITASLAYFAHRAGLFTLIADVYLLIQAVRERDKTTTLLMKLFYHTWFTCLLVHLYNGVWPIIYLLSLIINDLFY